MKKLKRTLLIAVLLLAAAGLAVSVWQLWLQFSQQAALQNQNQTLVEQVVALPEETPEAEKPAEADPLPVPPIAVDFAALREKNEDVVAWIYCEGTAINHPVAQGESNDTYLRRLLDGTYNRAGTIFMDYRNKADFSHWNTVIYGHNMQDDTMFGTLPLYEDPAWYEAHPVWWLLTPEQNYRVDLIAASHIRADARIYAVTDTVAERNRILQMVRDLSDFSSPTEVGEKDRLVTFSTCTYDRADARYILVGVLREAQ